MADYVIDIHRLDPTTGTFTKLDEIVTWLDLSYNKFINKIGSCRFNLAVQDKKATRSNLVRFSNHVGLRRNNSNKPIWFGPITAINGSFENVRGQISIESNTYLYHLKSRFTDFNEIFSKQNIIEIMIDLLNETQSRTNGDLAINVPNPVPNSIERERSMQYKQLSREMIEQTELIGSYDFDFDPQNDNNQNITGINWNVYPNRLGKVRDDLPSLYLHTNKKRNNISSIQLTNSSEIFNQSIVQGAGTSNGDTPIISEQSRGRSQRFYTRREIVQALKSAQLTTTLSTFNTAYLNKFSVEQLRIDIQMLPEKLPTINEVSMGDILNLDINVGNPDGYLNLQKISGRMIGYDMAVDSEGTEFFTPRLEVYRS